MVQYINKCMALSSEEWKLLLAALVKLPIVTILLYTCGFKKTQSLLMRFLSHRQSPEISGDEKEVLIKSIVRMVKIAVNYSPYHNNCLKYSMVLWWELTRKGIASVIRFGVNKEKSTNIDAHAWVEVNGINVSDSISMQESYLVLQEPGT